MEVGWLLGSLSHSITFFYAYVQDSLKQDAMLASSLSTVPAFNLAASSVSTQRPSSSAINLAASSSSIQSNTILFLSLIIKPLGNAVNVLNIISWCERGPNNILILNSQFFFLGMIELEVPRIFWCFDEWMSDDDRRYKYNHRGRWGIRVRRGDGCGRGIRLEFVVELSMLLPLLIINYWFVWLSVVELLFRLMNGMGVDCLLKHSFVVLQCDVMWSKLSVCFGIHSFQRLVFVFVGLVLI